MSILALNKNFVINVSHLQVHRMKHVFYTEKTKHNYKQSSEYITIYNYTLVLKVFCCYRNQIISLN